MSIKSEKADQYAMKLQMQLAEIFNEDSENYIDPNELEDGDNANAFFHALATLMPGLLYMKLTGDDVDCLGFNHIANRLAAQFAKFS